MSILLAALTGLVAGVSHVFVGPDHLAAVAPLAVDQRERTWRLGLLWGIGHSGGVWLLALLAMVLREALPVELLSTWSERLVGVVLVGIGLLGVRKVFRTRVHTHEHEHDGVRHKHLHLHVKEPAAAPDHPRKHSHSHSALGIGTLHGLAGTAHLLGVLPALLLPTRLAALFYVVAFGLGSIVAMTVFSWVLGVVAGKLDHKGTGTYRWLVLGSCTAAIAIGCFWIYDTFSAAAHVAHN